MTLGLASAAHAGVEVIPEPGGGSPSRTCKGTPAVIAGKGLCLRAGLRCDPKRDRLFKRYGYRCRKAKARRGHKRPKLSKLTLGDAARRRFGDAIPIASNGRIDKATA